MVNMKTPNKNRKSLANVEGESPKAATLDTAIKTPGKAKGKGSPGKFNKSPKAKPQQQNNAAKTPKQTPQKAEPKTPKQTTVQLNSSAKKSNKKNKRSIEAESESSPPKKMKMFSGTSDLQESHGKKKQGKGPVAEVKQQKEEPKGDGKKTKRKGTFFHLKAKVHAGDSAALTELREKIKAIEERKELTKTARRKLKMLQRMKAVMTGEKIEVKAPTASKKRRERKKEAKAKHASDETKQAKPDNQQLVKKVEAVEQDEDSSESDYEVDAAIKPDSIIKTGNVGEEDDSEDDDDESDGEDESGEEEESSDDEEIEGEEDGGSEGDSDEEEEEEVQPAKVQQKGGKKKGDEKKNEVKAKNLKLQAMRKQGQLAGSVKENQKRSARRGKKNAKAALNGSN